MPRMIDHPIILPKHCVATTYHKQQRFQNFPIQNPMTVTMLITGRCYGGRYSSSNKMLVPTFLIFLWCSLLASRLNTAPVLAAVLLEPSMETFGGALKSFPFRANYEQTLFQFEREPVPGQVNPHVITEQWFSIFGGVHKFDPNTDARIRIYIDDESNNAYNTNSSSNNNSSGKPSLDFQLYFAHTIGVQNCVNNRCSDTRVPWASSEVQHMAHAGALKNRYRIPFRRRIRITITLPYPGVAYYLCRGMTHLPVVVGDLQLPPTARLNLYKNWAVDVAPLNHLPLVQPRLNSSGLLYATIWSAESEYIGFMEGCVRAEIDGRSVLLSSGTEDYFESANFFNAGHPTDSDPGAYPWPNASAVARNNIFTRAGSVSSPESGVGYLSGTNPYNYSMSAYKFHLSDPIVWWNSFNLTASNYDHGGGDPSTGALGCFGRAQGAKPTPASRPVRMWTYAWTYEW